jgi:uncharacterized protein (DUF1697 family)
MAVFVCLIRAIGPGTHEKMSMAALREACETAGLTDVTTVGNTGNIICRSKKSPHAVRRLVQGVVDGFGLGPSCEVFVRTPVQMAHVVKANPLPDAVKDHPSYVGVCSFHKSPRWSGLDAYNGPMRHTHVGAHLIRDAGDGSGIGRFNIEKLIGARMTERNWRVFANLAAKAAALQES